jgi:hypothetical protein
LHELRRRGGGRRSKRGLSVEESWWSGLIDNFSHFCLRASGDELSSRSGELSWYRSSAWRMSCC